MQTQLPSLEAVPASNSVFGGVPDLANPKPRSPNLSGENRAIKFPLTMDHFPIQDTGISHIYGIANMARHTTEELLRDLAPELKREFFSPESLSNADKLYRRGWHEPDRTFANRLCMAITELGVTSPTADFHPVARKIDGSGPLLYLKVPYRADHDHGQVQICSWAMRAYAEHHLSYGESKHPSKGSNSRNVAWKFAESAILGNPEQFIELLERAGSLHNLHTEFDVPLGMSMCYAAKLFPKHVNFAVLHSLHQIASNKSHLLCVSRKDRKCTATTLHNQRILQFCNDEHLFSQPDNKPAHHQVEACGEHRKTIGTAVCSTYKIGRAGLGLGTNDWGIVRRTVFMDTRSPALRRLLLAA